MTDLALPPTLLPKTADTTTYLSIPLAVDLTRRSNWFQGDRQWIFRMMRLHLVLEHSWVSRDRCLSRVDPTELSPSATSPKRYLVVSPVPDIRETVRNSVLRPGTASSLSEALSAYETTDGVRSRVREARDDVKSAILPDYWRQPDELTAERRHQVFSVKTSTPRPSALTHVRTETDVYLSYVDFLRVEYRLGMSHLRVRRTKVPKVVVQKNAKVNEIDMQGQSLGRFSHWSADGVVGDVSPETPFGNPFGVSRSGGLPSSSKFGRHGFEKRPSLYQISNVSFSLRPELSEEQEWSEDMLSELGLDVGDRHAWLSHITRDLNDVSRNLRRSSPRNRSIDSELWKR